VATAALDNILTIKSNSHIYVKGIATGQSFFLRTIRESIRALWSGQWQLYDFIGAFYNAIHTFYYRAWFEGAEECGILPDEMTNQESFWLRSRILQDQLYADRLGVDIETNNRESGGKLYVLYPRANLWANNYNEVRNMAQFMSCSDQKAKWVATARESCPSCMRLNGIVKRMSYWREHDVHPQHRGKLQCMINSGGVPVCLCGFEKTDEPVTPGPLPMLP
jgi:hypothetical protein